MAVPEAMLSSRAEVWPAHSGWIMEPKWDGFRLLVAVDRHGRKRAWSRRGASLGERVGPLLEPLADVPGGTIFDTELVALSARDGTATQDFSAVCRAALRADATAAQKLHLVAFNLRARRHDIRALPWTERTKLVREALPAEDRLRLVQPRPTSRAAHDQLIARGFEGSVLKRPAQATGGAPTWPLARASGATAVETCC